MTVSAARRDGCCGAVLVATGGVAVWEALRHRLGTLLQMQAGYFPLILGVLLIALGLMIALAGLGTAAQAEDGEEFQAPDWRGCIAIVVGVASFIGVGNYFGLGPATFCCVFISARGDRMMTLRASLLLAAAITVLAVVLFAYLLQVQFPVVQWPFS